MSFLNDFLKWLSFKEEIWSERLDFYLNGWGLHVLHCMEKFWPEVVNFTLNDIWPELAENRLCLTWNGGKIDQRKKRRNFLWLKRNLIWCYSQIESPNCGKVIQNGFCFKRLGIIKVCLELWPLRSSVL